MIQASELRIGNYFKAEPYSFDILQVKALGSQWVIIDNGSLFYKSIKPIPITEEWLLKFGFKKHESDVRFYQNGSLKIKVHENGWQFRWYDSMVYIKGIHQLQNLYFALTNNELNIQL